MSLVFVEYKIIEAKRTLYVNKINAIMEKYKPYVQVLEGADQPGLFVELWSDMTLEQYEKWKQERLNGSMSIWNEIHACIQGGQEKVHIWRFTPLKI